MEKGKFDFMRLTDRYQEKENQVHRLRDEKRSLSEEKQALLLRLSRYGVINLNNNSNGNPDIADLSDEKRPTQFADEFSEIYDNEWTDAFEELKFETEEENVNFMLRILMKTYQECHYLAKDHNSRIKDGLCKPTQRSQIMTSNDTSESTVEQNEIIQEATKKEKEANNSPEVEAVADLMFNAFRINKEEQSVLVTYIEKCCNICWSMCRHNPPVHVEFPDITEDIPFDTNKYTPYTKSGEYIDYIVWPPLFQHEGGPLLRKGVAQGGIKDDKI